MFDAWRIRGGAASLVWGYRTVAGISDWTASRAKRGEVRLVATLTQADARQCQQAAEYRELIFVAPRDTGTPWTWGLDGLKFEGRRLTGRLALLAQ